jgi:hypothetical protein
VNAYDHDHDYGRAYVCDRGDGHDVHACGRDCVCDLYAFCVHAYDRAYDRACDHVYVHACGHNVREYHVLHRDGDDDHVCALNDRGDVYVLYFLCILHL